jgi:hypothetical protein
MTSNKREERAEVIADGLRDLGYDVSWFSILQDLMIVDREHFAIGDYLVHDDGMIEIVHEYQSEYHRERGELTAALEKLGLGKWILREPVRR